MPDLLHRLVSTTGAVSWPAARDAGVTRSAWQWAAHGPEFVRLRRGVLVPTASGAQALVVLAAAQAAVPSAVVSHASAAGLHGLALLRPLDHPPTLSMAKTAGRTPWTEGGVRFLVSAVHDEDVTVVGGLRVTTMARTCIDLCRATEFRDGLVATDAALRGGLALGDFEGALLRMKGWPGTRTAARVLRHADARRESVLESFGSAVWVEQGLPRSTPQVWIYDEDGFVGRVDELWEDHATVGEADGMVKYRQPYDTSEHPLVAEKVRQERLERSGLAVVRYGSQDLWRRPRQTADRVREAFARARTLTPRFIASPVMLSFGDANRAWNARYLPVLDWRSAASDW